MSKLAVIGTFYKRHENTEALFKRVLFESTRTPDEFYVMCEGEDDVKEAEKALDEWDNWFTETIVWHAPTPYNSAGTYAVIPYSNKINLALNTTTADYIVCLLYTSPSPRD